MGCDARVQTGGGWDPTHWPPACIEGPAGWGGGAHSPTAAAELPIAVAAACRGGRLPAPSGARLLLGRPLAAAPQPRRAARVVISHRQCRRHSPPTAAAPPPAPPSSSRAASRRRSSVYLLALINNSRNSFQNKVGAQKSAFFEISIEIKSAQRGSSEAGRSKFGLSGLALLVPRAPGPSAPG